MKKVLLVLVFLLLSSLSGAFAQTFTLYTQDNSGIAYNAVYCIDVDRNGVIWFGGQKSAATGVANVSTFNPATNTWKVYQQVDLALPEDRVYYIAEDTAGNLWFCTHYGFSVLRTNGTAEPIAFTDGKYSRTVQSDARGKVYLSIRENTRADSRIYVSSDFGTTWPEQWDMAALGYALTQAQARPEIYDLRDDSRGWEWLCTYYGVSYKEPGAGYKSIAAIESQYTYAMTIDKNDHVWVSEYNTPQLHEILPDLSIVSHTAATIPPLASKIEDLEADRNGHIWCALNGGGLLEIKPDGTYTQYNSASTNGAIPEDILTHLEIINDEIWVSTSASGILRVRGIISNVEKEETAQPGAFTLQPNFPNPFNPSTQIRYHLQETTEINLAIYDRQGRLIRTLVSGRQNAGEHIQEWNGFDENGRSAASGVYLCVLTASGQIATQKMTLLK
jgi:streptogramin lyase